MRYCLYITFTITVIGTAIITPNNHNNDHKINIITKISIGLTHKVWDIISGTKILFSVHCTTEYKIHAAINHLNPYARLATKIHGTAPSIGPRYGINSVSQAIRAKVKLLGNQSHNQFRITNHSHTISPTVNDNNTCPNNQLPNLSYKPLTSFSVWCGVDESDEINFVTHSFSKEPNTATVNTIAI